MALTEMLQLHYFPGNASLIVHLVLEEIGAPFMLEYVDRDQAAHKAPAYLALNPNGLIPVLVDDAIRDGDGAPLVDETAAISMHLAETRPAPPSCLPSARPSVRAPTSGSRGARAPCRPRSSCTLYPE